MKFFTIVGKKVLTLIAFFISIGVAQGASLTVGDTVVKKATWYGQQFHGRLMANGKKFDMHDPFVVAHKTLPINSLLLVRNVKNGKILVVRVQDRGPYRKDPNFVLDLSYAGAEQLGYTRDGKAVLEITLLTLG